jgi:CHASE2 domain-containing sensor protein
LKSSFPFLPRRKKSVELRRIDASRFSLWAGVLVSFFVALFFLLNVFENLESRSLDLRMKLRGPLAVHPSIRIVGIDDTSLSVFGRWPWPRSYQANFLGFLSVYQPKTVVYDMIFPEPTEDNPEEDQAFSEALEKNGSSVLGMFFRQREGDVRKGEETLEPVLAERLEKFSLGPAGGGKVWFQGAKPSLTIALLGDAAKGMGYVNVTPDADGKMRRIPLVIYFNGKLYPSLALETVLNFWNLSRQNLHFKPGHWIEIEQKDGARIRIPVDGEGFTVVNYAGPIQVFRPLSFAQLMAFFYGEGKTDTHPIVEKLKSSILLIGVSATASTDLISTPYVGLEPGISLQASLVNSILQQKFIYPCPGWLSLLILLGIGLSLGYWVPRIAPAGGFLIFLSLGLAYPFLVFLLFISWGFWLPVVAPLLAVGISYLAVVFIQFIGERLDKQALEQELAIAQRIQRSFLPKNLPETEEAVFAAETVMAKSVGGDLYDFITFENGAVGVTIGDVSGKGVPAALYMAKTISDFRTHAKLERSPASVITKLNETLVAEGASGMFVTLFYLLFEPAKKKLSFSSAGHHPLLKWEKASGVITEHNTKKGKPLGILSFKDLDEGELALASGDLLVLYTDGIDEAMNRSRQTFGKGRILEVIQKNCTQTPQEIIQAFHKAVQSHAGSAPQHDDMTLVVIKIGN